MGINRIINFIVHVQGFLCAVSNCQYHKIIELHPILATSTPPAKATSVLVYSIFMYMMPAQRLYLRPAQPAAFSPTHEVQHTSHIYNDDAFIEFTFFLASRLIIEFFIYMFCTCYTRVVYMYIFITTSIFQETLLAKVQQKLFCLKWKTV